MYEPRIVVVSTTIFKGTRVFYCSYIRVHATVDVVVNLQNRRCCVLNSTTTTSRSSSVMVVVETISSVADVLVAYI